MKKAFELRQHLLDHVPALKKDPKRLLMFIPKGHVACSPGSPSFAWRYDIEITVTDLTDHADTLVVPLLAWISVNEPDLLQNFAQNKLLAFEAELIDHEKSDVRFVLPLTERVIVSTNGEGKTIATHCGEPALPELTGPSPWRLFVNNEEVLPA